MIGQMGEASVAAVGLANQMFFLLTLLLFGINSGAAIFTAQLWGKRDVPNIRKVLGISLLLNLVGSAVFTALSVGIPEVALSVYTQDAEVIGLGSGYLRIFGLSFLFMAITFCYYTVLRSTGDVRTPLLVSMSALSLNALLSYGLIFGNLGLPALGVNGAALSIFITRSLECAAILWITYHRSSPAAASLKEMASFDRGFANHVLQRVLPVTFNEILWSLGVTVYNIVYARIGTEALAAMNIAASIDNLALVFFIGIAHACAILVGNWIGANEERKAFEYAGKSLTLGIAGGVLMGLMIFAAGRWILAFYKVSPLVIDYAQKVLAVIALTLWIRVSNLLMFVGIFRSGGDTRFAFILDVGAIWVIGVPLAFLGAFVFHLPVYIVYLLVMIEELVKWIFGIMRFFSKSWINNLARAT
jgi:putative MATE family efflux protein